MTATPYTEIAAGAVDVMIYAPYSWWQRISLNRSPRCTLAADALLFDHVEAGCCGVRFTVDDPDTDGATIARTIPSRTLAAEARRMVVAGVTCWGSALTADPCDWDADSGDMLLQRAVLGSVVYG